MEKLIDEAIKIAYRAAKEYADTHQQELPIDDKLIEALKKHLKVRYPQAIADAKEALDANMGMFAEQTFAASIALAGIDAAKEVAA